MRLRDLATLCARVVHLFLAPKEGVGNAGCPLHPRPRVRFVLVESTRVTTSTPESPGIPARNGFNGLCRALPGDRALLPPSSAEQGFVTARLGQQSSANLTPASGRQDHTILPSAAIVSRQRAGDRSQIPENLPCDPIARQTLPRPPHPVPTSVTIAKRPSVGRDGESCRSDLGQAETEIFSTTSKIGLDRKITAEPVGQISRPVRRHFEREAGPSQPRFV